MNAETLARPLRRRQRVQLEVVTGRAPRPLSEPLLPHQIVSGTLARLLPGTRTVLPLDEDHAALVQILGLVRGILGRRREPTEPAARASRRRRRKPTSDSG
jgi:hypothetical protein